MCPGAAPGTFSQLLRVLSAMTTIRYASACQETGGGGSAGTDGSLDEQQQHEGSICGAQCMRKTAHTSSAMLTATVVWLRFRGFGVAFQGPSRNPGSFVSTAVEAGILPPNTMVLQPTSIPDTDRHRKTSRQPFCVFKEPQYRNEGLMKQKGDGCRGEERSPPPATPGAMYQGWRQIPAKSSLK